MTFDFRVQQQVKVWEESGYSVEAESYEKALELMKDHTRKISNEYDVTDVENIKLNYCKKLDNTTEPCYPTEKYLDLYDDDDDVEIPYMGEK